MFWRVRLRLALWSAAALAVIVLVLGVAAYLAVRREIDRDINASILQARDELLAGGRLAESLRAPSPSVDGEREPHEPHDYEDEHEREGAGAIASEVFFLTTDRTGTVLANPRQVAVAGIPFARLQAEAGTGEIQDDVSARSTRYRVLTVFIGPAAAGEPAYLHVGYPLAARDRQLFILAWVLGAGGIAGVVLSALGGLWLAGRALVPIRRSLEAQQRFVSDASHELRTPLAAIKANNELLLLHPDSTVADNLEQVEAIAAEVDHMASLVEDLLTLARADEGQLKVKREPLDLSAVAADVARDLRPLAEASQIRLESELETSPVRGDRHLLRQLITILLENAVKYTPAGGTVTLRCRPGELSVSDTGPGIAPEHQKHLFDRFYRVDKARSRQAGGTGLGLAIGRWIAEAHGGTIAVTSTPGRGSMFTVRIPARTSPG